MVRTSKERPTLVLKTLSLIQFNVVDSRTLRKAQSAPDDYRDLLVRVAGYSDYFIDLDEYHQEEIIARTEQESF